MNTPPSGPAEPNDNRQSNRVKLALGCTGIAMMLCTGTIMLMLIVTPIAFRSLPPEYQDKFMRRLPFLAAFKPTQPFAYLPTAASTNANAMSLLNATQEAFPTLPKQTASLSAGGSDFTNTPTPILATNTPAMPTSTPLPVTVSPSPVLGGITPTLVVPAVTDVPPVAPSPTDIPVPVSFRANGFEWVPQGWNNCGPANLTQALKFYGWKGNQDEAAGYLKPNREDKNVSPWQMVEFVNTQTGVKALWRVAGDMNLIQRLVVSGFAVIMETGYDVAGEGWMGHYLTVVGYDDNQSTLYGLDTWLGDGKGHQGYPERYDDLDRRWQAFNRAYIVIYPATREGELARLLGPDADLQYNYFHALSVARLEASAQPNNPYAWFNLGSSYTLLQKYKDAVIAFDQAQAVGALPFRMLWYQFTPYEAYYNVGNYQAVLALAQTALVSTQYVEETYYWQGMAYAALGKTGQATDNFKRVLKFNPNFLPASDMLTQLSSGKYAPPVVAQASN